MSLQLPIIVSQIAVAGECRVEDRHGYAGKLVRVRPIIDNPEKKTYVGIYLGELIDSPKVFYYSDENKLRVASSYTPAIFVPALNRIVWESHAFWDRPTNTEDLFLAITESEIDGIPFGKIATLNTEAA